jgi:gas vesicle protein
MAKDDSSSAIAWFVAGAATGAAIALLYAPRTGRDTRKLLNRTTREGREAVESGGKELMDRGRDLYDKGRKIADDAADLFERGRKLVRH